jgi:hypothetical protein
VGGYAVEDSLCRLAKGPCQAAVEKRQRGPTLGVSDKTDESNHMETGPEAAVKVPGNHSVTDDIGADELTVGQQDR